SKFQYVITEWIDRWILHMCFFYLIFILLMSLMNQYNGFALFLSPDYWIFLLLLGLLMLDVIHANLALKTAENN
ncbi:hypothetical protein ACJX0J_025377, partial [Zea mays]